MACIITNKLYTKTGVCRGEIYVGFTRTEILSTTTVESYANNLFIL